LYSHDAQGLGHVRRNLALAGALQLLDPAPDVLLLTGAPEAAALRRPSRTDLVGLPALAKSPQGAYTARHLSVAASELAELRTALLTATLTTFVPDLLVVDRHPRGFRGELEPALERLNALGCTRVVLGLRDVIDDPVRTRLEWRRDRGSQALARYYDQVWLYGDPAVYDAGAVLGLDPDLATTIVATGYLARGRDHGPGGRRPPAHRLPARYVLCVLGGGGDGGAVAEAFARAPLPAGHAGVLVTGPQMPQAAREAVRVIAAGRDGLLVYEFLDDVERWLGHAAAVVSMGGYNSVCEALAAGRPLLVVPRVRPRAEQLVRATALARTGLVDLLHPDELDPLRLGRWAASAVRRGPRPPSPVDLDGLARIPALAKALLGGRRPARRGAGHVA
jgi:predicted glycosyltransferase